MAQTYAFQVSMPVTDTMPRNRITNTLHFEHVIGGVVDDALNTMCQDIAAMWQTRYGIANKEVMVKAYDTDAVPNYPRATVVVNPGQFWTCVHPHEVALCLSYAGANKGIRNERGRIYLMPSIAAGGMAVAERPDNAVMAWALAFYSTANSSLPDLGGIDWKFGVWSKTYKKFTQAQQAWCDDEWDTQRKRGLRPTTRVTSTREG